MEMDNLKQMIKELLEGMEKRIIASIHAYHEKRMAMFDAYEKRMMKTCNTHIEIKKIEQDPEMMQSVEEHQDISTEDVAEMPVGEPNKRRRVR
jgi:hypothetical protein